MASAHPLEMKLEVVVIPVSDVGRAIAFYEKLGWRKDIEAPREGGGRLVQFTPPGSQSSIIFGNGASPAAPGSAQFNHLVVSDLEAARQHLVAKGIEVGEVFHDAAGGYNPFDPAARAGGPDPQRRSYLSFASFKDPDGNVWLLQEVTARLPGRVDAAATCFTSVPDLAGAMKRAETAHGDHEKRTGVRDENWPEWYAAYMVAEQTGAPPPQ